VCHKDDQVIDLMDALKKSLAARAALCVRWGAGPDRCVRAYDHVGPCQDARGETTLTLAAAALARVRGAA